MKRTLIGASAYHMLVDAPLPPLSPYAPLGHQDLSNDIRKQIFTAGYRLSGEDYKSTADGVVGLVQMRIVNKPLVLAAGSTFIDPDLEMSVCFLNSYSKEYGFKFALAAKIPNSDTSFMLDNELFGLRKPPAGTLTFTGLENLVHENLHKAGEYWQLLVKRKNQLKKRTSSAREQHDIIGILFLRQGLLNTLQMSTIKKALTAHAKKHSMSMNSWEFYQLVAKSLIETHPAEWMKIHARVHEVFSVVMMLAPAPLSSAFLCAVSAATPAAAEDEAVAEDPMSEVNPAYYTAAVDPVTGLETTVIYKHHPDGKVEVVNPTVALETLEKVFEDITLMPGVIAHTHSIKPKVMTLLPRRPATLDGTVEEELVIEPMTEEMKVDEFSWDVPPGDLSESDQAEDKDHE